MTTRHDAPTGPRKKPYQRPALAHFGRLQDLTTGGTGNASEGSQGQRPRP